MKKNISINISGIIFHIEEDGYENLRKYLDSINRYFSSFEDSSEILADIEGRIAEIFLAKLNEEKQIITSDDVNSLIATMGSVSDFRAAEESAEQGPASTGTESASKEEMGSAGSGGYAYAPPKRLYRDQKRKVIGGVCAGLGSYFNMDALWFRLIFAALFFAGGFTVLVYIVMWIVIPESYTLEEPAGKKMFRDPQGRIIGGVSGGVAAYFGLDTILVRVLFIALTFAAGFGFFLYIILWICLPEARSITDKIQMQGEPVTLSNIESSIKKNLNIREGESESTLTRILLLPFRLVGALLTALGKILVPLGDIVRIIVGIVAILTGLSLVFATVVTAAVLFGLFAESSYAIPGFADFHDMDLPIEVFTRAFPGWVVIAAIIATLVPSIVIMLLGASAIANKLVFRRSVGWTLFALFFISAAMLAVGIPRIFYSFHDDGEYRVEHTYKVDARRAVLRMNEGSSDYDAVRLTLRGYEGTNFRLVQTFESQGSSRGQAIENAKMVDYNFQFQDSVFTFDDELRFKENAVFRGQHLDMTLYIPYDFPFTMDYATSRFISQYVDSEFVDGYTWKMTRNGLECIDCGDQNTNEDSASTTVLRDFNDIEISGKFDVRIVQGDQYAVELSGNENVRDHYAMRVTGETLIINYIRERHFDWEEWEAKGFSLEEVDVTVTLPDLERIEANGMGNIRLDNIRGDRLAIEARGPVKMDGRVEVDDLTVRLTGKSDVDLSGKVRNMNARVEFLSRLRAYNLEARKAFVEVGGSSFAKVNVVETLEIDEGIASDVDYRGNPQIVRHD